MRLLLNSHSLVRVKNQSLAWNTSTMSAFCRHGYGIHQRSQRRPPVTDYRTTHDVLPSHTVWEPHISSCVTSRALRSSSWSDNCVQWESNVSEQHWAERAATRPLRLLTPALDTVNYQMSGLSVQHHGQRHASVTTGGHDEGELTHISHSFSSPTSNTPLWTGYILFHWFID